MRPRLKDEAIPSVFAFKKDGEDASRRRERLEARRAAADASVDEDDGGKDEGGDQEDEASADEASGIIFEEDPASRVEMEVEVVREEGMTAMADKDAEEVVDVVMADSSTQCNMNSLPTQWSHGRLQEYPKMVLYYTGFDDIDHFNLFFGCLGPAATNLRKFSSLPDPKDQLLITLMKLRRNKDDIELGMFFNISMTTVGEIFNVWINFMYYQLKELDLWPEAAIIEDYMPKNFAKLFAKTKVIVDATETPIMKPEHVEAQSVTFSTYKNCNTVKTIVGCSPRCVTTYVSDSYGGSVSDRQIIERSTLLTQFPFKPNDQLMADRGIMVQDLFATKDVQVITPHTLKGRHQLDSQTLVYDRRVASKRIHIERIIGLAKTFMILKYPLNGHKLHLANRIIFICLIINNFRQCIISKFG